MKTFQKDKLCVKVMATRTEMGQVAAQDIHDRMLALLAEKDEINMIFAAAPSQNEVLKALVDCKDIPWNRVNAFHMDEYIGLDKNAPQGFGNFLTAHIFGLVPFKSVNLIDCSAVDPQAESERYADLLREHPTDIVVMGIGENGHIAFNDPPVADFDDSKWVKPVKLDDICRQQQVNDGCFATIADVPAYAMTLTCPTLMRATWKFCIVPAPTKAEAVKRTLTWDIGEKCPATILRRSDNATLYLDPASAANLDDVVEGEMDLRKVRKHISAVLAAWAVCGLCLAQTEPARRFERDLLPMVAGTDRYSLGDVTLAPTNGLLQLVTRGGRCTLKPHWLPGAARRKGVDEIALKLDRAFSGGSVTLRLRDEASRQILSFTQPWTEDVRFPVKVSPDSFWYFVGLDFELPAESAERSFAVLGMSGTRCVSSSADAFSLDVATDRPLSLLTPGACPTAVIRNCTDLPQKLDVCLRLRDFYGHGFDVPCREMIGANETLEKALPAPDRMGYWQLSGEFRAGDACATSTCSFAVLTPRTVTPAWGANEFRIGTTCHLQWYPETVRENCLKALVAIGAKVVRYDSFAPSDICPAPDTWDWAFHEGLLQSLERNGLSLHAIVYRCPNWACVQNGTPHGHLDQNCAMRSGLFEDYCRTLASRYGTRIAYYEIGNEWDLARATLLSDEDAIRIQAEAMRGLHAGCSNAVCVVNGWAGHPWEKQSRYRTELHRKFVGDHSDSFDVYAIHYHGRFKWYEPAVRNTLSFLKQKGVKKPWYSDESALSSSDGNEIESAQTVWKKCLFAWSQGSIAFSWYNLRASGYNPKNEEHGYGMFTPDFHPRPSAAAFAALTDLFAHVRFETVLEDSPTLYLARWRGQRNGREVCVCAGWSKKPDVQSESRLSVDGSRAWRVDLMGNRTPLSIADGSVACSWSEEPSAVLIER